MLDVKTSMKSQCRGVVPCPLILSKRSSDLQCSCNWSGRFYKCTRDSLTVSGVMHHSESWTRYVHSQLLHFLAFLGLFALLLRCWFFCWMRTAILAGGIAVVRSGFCFLSCWRWWMVVYVLFIGDWTIRSNSAWSKKTIFGKGHYEVDMIGTFYEMFAESWPLPTLLPRLFLL